MENQLSYEVSDKDLKNRIHSPFKLVLYPDLSNYQNITDILPNEFSILIILLEAGSGNHWTCLIRRNNILTYFDSYGKKPDGEFYLIPKATQKAIFFLNPDINKINGHSSFHSYKK